MIVGCVATLGPLFRRALNLGGDSVPERTPKDQHTMCPIQCALWQEKGGVGGVARAERRECLEDVHSAAGHVERGTHPGKQIKITKSILQSIIHPGEEEEEECRSRRT